jgi:hypothetical protein
MKIIASVLIYSGMKDPEMEISNDIAKEICNKLYNAYEKSDVELPSHLGFRGYMVVWHPENDYIPATIVVVHNGIIGIYSFSSKSYFKDTVGLENYLKNLLKPINPMS